MSKAWLGHLIDQRPPEGCFCYFTTRILLLLAGLVTAALRCDALILLRLAACYLFAGEGVFRESARSLRALRRAVAGGWKSKGEAFASPSRSRHCFYSIFAHCALLLLFTGIVSRLCAMSLISFKSNVYGVSGLHFYGDVTRMLRYDPETVTADHRR